MAERCIGLSGPGLAMYVGLPRGLCLLTGSRNQIVVLDLEAEVGGGVWWLTWKQSSVVVDLEAEQCGWLWIWKWRRL